MKLLVKNLNHFKVVKGAQRKAEIHHVNEPKRS